MVSTQVKVNERQSNFELLRIVAMLLIIMSHFSTHGGFEFSTETISLNRVWIQSTVLGNVGVNIFVLISGYFLIYSEKVSIAKILKLWIQIATYSIGIYVLFVLFGISTFNIKELVKSAFPITYQQWWFACTYFILYLLSPFINKGLRALEQKEFLHFLKLGGVIWILLPTFTNEAYESNGLIWFIYLYAVAAYIRIYSIKVKSRYCFFAAAGMMFLIVMSIATFDILGTKWPVFAEHSLYFLAQQKLSVSVVSLTLFIGFKGLEINYNRYINLISSTTFGIYLIHDNSLMRNFIWTKVFKNAIYAEKIILIPYSIGVVVIVFVICSFIEWIRGSMLEKHYMKKIKRIEFFIEEKMSLIRK